MGQFRVFAPHQYGAGHCRHLEDVFTRKIIQNFQSFLKHVGRACANRLMTYSTQRQMSVNRYDLNNVYIVCSIIKLTLLFNVHLIVRVKIKMWKTRESTAIPLANTVLCAELHLTDVRGES